MFEMLPLSPLRPHASLASGTSIITSSESTQAAGSRLADAAAGAMSPAGMSMLPLRPPSDTLTGTRALSSRNENGLISGDGDGRPADGPVVPGDHDVPDGAISRANISRARRS